jgi:hypothetical protein
MLSQPATKIFLRTATKQKRRVLLTRAADLVATPFIPSRGPFGPSSR